MRVKCTIAYDGHLFNGYQVQPGKRTVQSELEKRWPSSIKRTAECLFTHPAARTAMFMLPGRSFILIRRCPSRLRNGRLRSMPCCLMILPSKQQRLRMMGSMHDLARSKRNIATLYIRRNTRTYLNDITLTILHIRLMCRK